jgi:uncharacterized ferredoxin-like protein
MIINEQEIKQEQVLEIGKKMLIAARTAPKGRGLDQIEALLVTGEDIQTLADFMEAGVPRHGRLFFVRDAANIRLSQAVVLLGARQMTMSLNCGYCGYASCASKIEAGMEYPCAFPIVDLGIAIGSACSVAADNRVDTRVMFSAGVAALELGWLGSGITTAFAIPISATSKSPFFDRAPVV